MSAEKTLEIKFGGMRIIEINMEGLDNDENEIVRKHLDKAAEFIEEGRIPRAALHLSAAILTPSIINVLDGSEPE